jgi:hypothetical protein
MVLPTPSAHQVLRYLNDITVIQGHIEHAPGVARVLDAVKTSADDARMDEPVGHTIDGTPWEEPRGPHLPDRLTRIPRKLPRGSWAFVILAAATGLLLAFDRPLPLWPDTDADIGPYVRYVLDLILWVIPPIATILFGAALFVRHRRAWTTHGALALGLVMLAVAEAMQAASDRVAGLFWIVTPPADDVTFLTPGLTAYTLLTMVLIAVGTVYFARGVRAARRRPELEGRSRWAVTIALVATLLTVSVAVGGLVTMWRAASEDSGDGYLAYNAAILFVNWLTFAAQAYLAVVLWAGMASGEEPAGAWRLGTVGVWAILIGAASASIATAVLFAVATPEMDLTIWSSLGLVWSIVQAAGYLLLLAAFSRGLPSGPDDDRPALAW